MVFVHEVHITFLGLCVSSALHANATFFINSLNHYLSKDFFCYVSLRL
jgi:hypothetical protein